MKQEKLDAMATAMEQASFAAADKAKRAVAEYIDENCGDMGDKEKIAILMTAITLAYAGSIRTVAKCSQSQKELVGGMYMELIVPELKALED